MKSGSSLFGTTAMASASALRVAIQISILPIIGRLLGPHAYGQIALVSPFIFFLMMIAESGLGACIVRAENLTRALEGTIFIFSSIFSIIIILIFAALAFPLGLLLREPSFPTLLMGMSTILLLAALNIVPSALLLRNKKYHWIAISDVASTVGGVVAIVIGVFLKWDAWSIVAQQIVFWIFKTGVTMLGAQWLPSFTFRKSLIKENIGFGGNLTATSVLNFISRNIDNFLIGTFMGAEILGYYALAFQIIGVPQMIFNGSIYFTLFSKVSEEQRAGISSARQYLRGLRGSILLSAPMMIGIAVTAPLSVPLILGDKWMPTVPLIALLTPLGIYAAIGVTATGVLVGMGRAGTMFRQSIISTSTTVLAIICGLFFGAKAVALGVTLASTVNSFLLLRRTNKACGTTFRQVFKAMGVPLFSALCMGLAAGMLEYYLPNSIILPLRFIICVLAGIAVYTLLLFGLFHDHVSEDVAAIRSAFASRLRKRKA